MNRILLSLFVVTLMAAASLGATKAYFSDTAEVYNNTFATGTLDIYVNEGPSELGAKLNIAAPDEAKTSPVYRLKNVGNIDAKYLHLGIKDATDYSSGLWQKIWIKIEVSRDNVNWGTVYNDYIKNLTDVNLLGSYWSDFGNGVTQYMKYTVVLPNENSNQNAYMGKSMEWDFVIEGRTN